MNEITPLPQDNPLRKKRTYLPLLLSFLLPFLISGIVVLYEHLTTPGINTKVVGDGLIQYYPFLHNFRDKLINGDSLTYSWTLGMGSGYLSTFSYYLASPFFLLAPLVPSALMPHFYTLLLIVKLAFSGYCMAWFVRIVFGKNDMSLPIFALFYAFCAWSTGYARNIMWGDVFAMLPLLVAGTVSLLRDGKFRLYIITLASCLWSNYYCAFFCCIFVLLCFIGYCICKWEGRRAFLRRFLRIAICTLIGAGIACVLLIPTLLAMQNTYAATAQEHHLLSLNIIDSATGDPSAYGGVFDLLFKETIPNFIRAARRICNELLTGDTPTILEGLPNVFTGVSAIVLAVFYLCCGKISKRERVFSAGLLSFIFASFILRSLDYVWHGLHFTNMVPYRFSFLFSFVLIVMAYRAYLLAEEFKRKHLFVIIPLLLVLIGNAYIQGVAPYRLVLSILVTIGTIVFLLMNVQTGKEAKKLLWLSKHKKRIGAILFALIVVCEMSLCFVNGSTEVGLQTQYNQKGTLVYPYRQGELQELRAHMSQDELYRMETVKQMFINDAALHDYNGVSIFNSSANVVTNRFLGAYGIASQPHQNTYSYFEASPFTNTMCGIKYLYDYSGRHYNTDYNTLVATSGDIGLLENKSFISMGFMTDKDLADFVALDGKTDVFGSQEEIFRLATGIEEPLYTHYSSDRFIAPEGVSVVANGTSYAHSAASGRSMQDISILFTVEEDGLYLYATEMPEDGFSSIEVKRNGEVHHNRPIITEALFSLGNLKKGDEIEFLYAVAPEKVGEIKLDFVKQNNDVYDLGIAKLADEPLILSDFDDGSLKGTVNALSDGLFYTSVPYEPGWTAYVDGKEVSIAQSYDPQAASVKLTDAFISFPLSEGAHTIELCYSAPGLTAGIAISIVSLIAFAVLWILHRKDLVFLP